LTKKTRAVNHFESKETPDLSSCLRKDRTLKELSLGFSLKLSSKIFFPKVAGKVAILQTMEKYFFRKVSVKTNTLSKL
jgi:hypothetical protein